MEMVCFEEISVFCAFSKAFPFPMFLTFYKTGHVQPFRPNGRKMVQVAKNEMVQQRS
jgi:hypothetical protein